MSGDPEGKKPAKGATPAESKEPAKQPAKQPPKSETMTEVDLVLPHQIAMKQLQLEEENVAKARPIRELPSVEVKEEKDEDVDDDRPTKLDLRTLRDGADLVPEFSPGDFPTPVPPPTSLAAPNKDKHEDREDEDERPTGLDLRTIRSGEDLVPEFSTEDFPGPAPKEDKGASIDDDDKRTTDPDGKTPYQGSDALPQLKSSTPTVEVRTGVREKERKSRPWLVLVVTILVIAAFCLGYLLGRTTG